MELQANQRTILGKQVKALRRQGITPVNLYGRGMASQALQVPTAELHRVLVTTGRNALVDVTVRSGNSTSDSHKVMLRDIQRHPITGEILHVDLHRVELTERMEAEVSLVLVGESPAVERGLGTVVLGANTIRVEGLPGTLPSSIEIEVSVITEPHQAIHAKDVPLPPGVTLASDPELVVASVVARRGMEEERAAEEEEAVPTAEAGTEEKEETP